MGQNLDRIAFQCLKKKEDAVQYFYSRGLHFNYFKILTA